MKIKFITLTKYANGKKNLIFYVAKKLLYIK